MPLIARVMDEARHRIRRARPHRRHHRSRQLHRPARRHCRGARHRARRAASRRSGCPRSRLTRRRMIADGRQHPGGGGDRCAPRSGLSAGLRRRRPHAGAAAHRADARGGARGDGRAGAHRRLGRRAAGGGLADERSRRRCWSTQPPRRTSTGSRGSAPPPPRPRPAEAALSARARCAAAGRRPAAAPMIGLLARYFRAARAGACRRRSRAMPPRSRRCMRASFQRGWSDDEIEQPAARPRRGGASRHARPQARRFHHVAHGRGRSRNPVGRGRASRRRGAGLARRLLDLHLRRLAGLRRIAPCFWKSARTTCRRAGSMPAPASARSAAAQGYYPGPCRPAHSRAGAASRSGVTAIVPERSQWTDLLRPPTYVGRADGSSSWP